MKNIDKDMLLPLRREAPQGTPEQIESHALSLVDANDALGIQSTQESDLDKLPRSPFDEGERGIAVQNYTTLSKAALLPVVKALKIDLAALKESLDSNEALGRGFQAANRLRQGAIDGAYVVDGAEQLARDMVSDAVLEVAESGVYSPEDTEAMLRDFADLMAAAGQPIEGQKAAGKRRRRLIAETDEEISELDKQRQTIATIGAVRENAEVNWQDMVTAAQYWREKQAAEEASPNRRESKR